MSAQRAAALLDTTLAYRKEQVRMHIDAVCARIACAEGHTDDALRLAFKAADLDHAVEKHPVTPAAVLPARELFADLL